MTKKCVQYASQDCSNIVVTIAVVGTSDRSGSVSASPRLSTLFLCPQHAPMSPRYKTFCIVLFYALIMMDDDLR